MRDRMVWASHDSDITGIQDLNVETEFHRTFFRLYKVSFNKIIFHFSAEAT